MKSKYLKILISLILIVSLCLAFTVAQSQAISTPIVVGGGALAIGGLAWVIANAMGVNFDMSDYTSQTIGTAFDPWYSVQSTLTTSDFGFIKAIRAGYDGLRLSLAAYNAIKNGSTNIIDDNNIGDYETGQVSDETVFDLPLGQVFAVFNYTDGSISTPDGGTISTDPNATYPSTTYSPGLGSGLAGGNTGSRYRSDYPMSFMYGKNQDNTISVFIKFATEVNFRQFTIGRSIPTSTINLDYESEEVDTSFGQTALDNITVIFPETVLPSTASLDDILAAINNLVLTDPDSVTAEVDVSPPPPIPTDALGDIPFDQFIDIYGGSVFEEIDNQTQVIDTLGQSVGQYIQDQTDVIDTYGQSVVEGIENQTEVIDTAGQSVVTAVENQTDVIDTVGQDVVEAVEAVDTNIQAGNGILSGIRSLIGSGVNALEDIGEMVGELVEDIVLGTETLISGILNQIPSLFNVILSPIKMAASIWHYVVEWIQSITGPFQFIWSMANGTSYYIVLPVYASLAAAVVLAFYKRFGK